MPFDISSDLFNAFESPKTAFIRTVSSTSSTFHQMSLDHHLPSVSRNALSETIPRLTNETSRVVWSCSCSAHLSADPDVAQMTTRHPDPLIALCLTESVVMNRTALPWILTLNFLKIACPFKRRGTWFALLSRSPGPWWDVTIVQPSLWHGGLTTSGCF